MNPLISFEEFQMRLFGETKVDNDSRSLEKITFSTEHRRRFDAGDTLSRNCYYTLSESLGGNDRYTLLNELYAYNDFEKSGVIKIFDSAIKESEQNFYDLELNYGANHSGIYILAADNGIKKSTFINKWLRNGLFTLSSKKYPNLRFAIAHFPYTVEELKCENILDLRERRAQNWLIEKIKSVDLINSNFTGFDNHDWFYVLCLIIEMIDKAVHYHIHS